MFIEESNKLYLIKSLEDKIRKLQWTKEFGPGMIQKLEKEQNENPSKMEELQGKINQISLILMGADDEIKKLSLRLQEIM